MKSVVSCFIYLFSSVPGLDTVPLQFSSHIDHLAPGSVQPHKPLSRTRSEPLPQSQRALHTHLLQQQHSTQLLERLKQQTHLGKVRASKCTLSSIFTKSEKINQDYGSLGNVQICDYDHCACLSAWFKHGSFPGNVLVC